MVEEETNKVGLPQGWQRAETLNGVPYYISHETETTQWDHPEITQLMTDLSGANDIKYAAYRTAVKLRAIEKKLQLHLIDLSTVRAGFNDVGYSESFSEDEVDVQSLEGILSQIFSYQSVKSNGINVEDGVELTLNWLLNVYDQSRSGSLRILSAKIGLACLSVAGVQEKYKYIFDQISSRKGFIDKKRLRVFLTDALQILKYIKEYHCFARAGVEPAVQSCFDRAFIPERIGLQEFLDWMINEPQTVVWLPTLHRLAMSETVKHEGKCNICKMFPIVGFRYRCLKCFNFDMCQNCFWSGRISKNHKLSHPTQEYCLPATQKEDIKDFTKVVKSKVRRKKKKKEEASKRRFLPITADGAAQASDEEQGVDNFDYVDNESTTSFESHVNSDRFPEKEKTSKEVEPVSSRILRSRPVMDDEHQLISYYTSCLTDNRPPATSTPIATLTRIDHNQIRELDEIVETLEQDNRYLREKILQIQDEETRRSLIQTEENERIEEYNERLEARQEVLEDHNRRLEDQLSKLQMVVQQRKSTAHGKSSALQTHLSLSESKEMMKQLYSNGRSQSQFSHDFTHYTPFSPTTPLSYGTSRSVLKPLFSNNVPDYTSSQLKQNTTLHSQYGTSASYSSGQINGQYSKNVGGSYSKSGTTESTSSDNDLREIEERYERLLEPELEGSGDEPLENTVQMKLEDSVSSISDDQQSYLLTAASMVGEAVEGFVSSLSRETSGWKHFELDFTDNEEEV